MSMRKKQRILERLVRQLDVPAESLSGAPRITMSGGARVLVEGHRGLLEYSAERVAAAGAGCRILIRGEGLGLEIMNGRELVVTGKIWAVELE